MVKLLALKGEFLHTLRHIQKCVRYEEGKKVVKKKFKRVERAGTTQRVQGGGQRGAAGSPSNGRSKQREVPEEADSLHSSSSSVASRKGEGKEQ